MFWFFSAKQIYVVYLIICIFVGRGCAAAFMLSGPQSQTLKTRGVDSNHPTIWPPKSTTTAEQK